MAKFSHLLHLDEQMFPKRLLQAKQLQLLAMSTIVGSSCCKQNCAELSGIRRGHISTPPLAVSSKPYEIDQRLCGDLPFQFQTNST